MKKSIFLTVLLGLFFVSTAIADPGDTLWTKTYGGSAADAGWTVQQTTDGGFIVTGYTMSYGAGIYDVWLIKTDGSGNEEWNQTYGGYTLDAGQGVQQTTDGGYIVSGYTVSFGAGGADVWLIKTDGSGNEEWNQTFGGTGTDYGFTVQQTQDGGYIVVGYTTSYGAGGYDAWLIKTDGSGNEEWNQTFGGESGDQGRGVQQTQDGGYIITGSTGSYGGGGSDLWLIKTDGSGNEEWNQTFGGAFNDMGNSVQQTDNGGYIIAGWTESFGAGSYDFYLVRTDASGDSLWTQTYGGTTIDYGNSVDQTTDGGFIVAGYTNSFGAGSMDVWLIKTDGSGNEEWNQTFGGTEADYGWSVQQTTDGSFIVAGYTNSYGAGNNDFYLLKIAGEALPAVSIEIIPDDPPVTVPQGGSFGFTGSLTNNIEDPQVSDGWTMAIGPEKETYGPFKMRNDVDLEPYQTRAAQFNQHVPNLAPLGFYTYIAYCGDYPATVVDSSLFQIEVVAGPLTKAGEAGWVLTGSFDRSDDPKSMPSEFALSGNYPNPFNASTVISYELPTDTHVKLEIYNLFGQKVATVVDGQQEAGYRSVTWEDSEAASGVYFYKLTAGDLTEVKRMTLLR